MMKAPASIEDAIINLAVYGRGDRIRTCDPLVPNQVRYRPALLPDGLAANRCSGTFLFSSPCEETAAVREGFEPSIRFNNVCQFSKLVDSASLPPHLYCPYGCS